MERARSGQPVFTVIGGPNGTGKSTYTGRLAAAGYDLGEVVNPDVIAVALPGPDTTRDVRAGRETLHRTRALIVDGQTFSRETTLSGRENSPHNAGGQRRWFQDLPVLCRCGFPGNESETCRGPRKRGRPLYPLAGSGTSFRSQLR